jgi:hypothetical protein
VAPRVFRRRCSHSFQGTPMFMATEITTGVLFTDFGFETTKFFTYVKTLPWATALFKDAAKKLSSAVEAQLTHLSNTNKPNVDVGEAWSAMASSLEAPAHPAPASSNTPISHVPQHDAESIFWLLWFLLARANPKGHPPVQDRSKEQVSYDNFCNDMLGHTIGNTADSRSTLLKNELLFYEWTLHPEFKSLGKMLYWMGKYLQVPRDKWAPKDPYAVHDMMQLLLLAESVRIKSLDMAKIPLDTMEPRPATRHVADIQATATTVESRITHSAGSGVIVGQGGQKRKRTAEAGDNVPNKRHSSNPFDIPSSTRQKMKDRHSNPEGSGGPSAQKVPASFPQGKPRRNPQRKPRTSTADPFQTRTEHNLPIVPNRHVPISPSSIDGDVGSVIRRGESDDEPEGSHTDVKGLEGMERGQLPLAVTVALEMQKEMLQADEWFTMRVPN